MEKKTNSSELPNAADMPRERLLMQGAEALADYELLALLLRTGGGGRSVLAFAQHILQLRGGLVGLLRSEQQHLSPIKGLGNAKIAEILAVAELAKRFVKAELQTRQWRFQSADDVRDFLLMHYKGLSSEEVGVLLLDAQHQYLDFVQFREQSRPDEIGIPLRELIRKTLHSNAAAVILVHNHPSGFSDISAADKQHTAQIQDLLHAIQVRLLDHFIVCGNKIISMREQGIW